MKEWELIKADREFWKKIKQMQHEKEINGQKVSIKDITKQIVSSPEFKDIENRILKNHIAELKLRLDKGKLI